jgi:hypothetical protein
MRECLNGEDDEKRHRLIPDGSDATGIVTMTDTGITIIVQGFFSFGDPVKEKGMEVPLPAGTSVTGSRADRDEMIA